MDLEARLKELETLNAVSSILNQERTFSAALDKALERLIDLVNVSTGWVFLTRVDEGDSHRGGFRLAAYSGLPPALEDDGQAELCEGSCECQGMFARGELDTGVNMVTCSRLSWAEGDKGGLEVHASVPLLGQSGPLGILNLAAPGNARFAEETLQFLTTVGRQLGVAFERARWQAARRREVRLLAALEERNRLARDMHDAVAQLLFAADLSLDAAQQSRDEAHVTRAHEAIKGAQAELRSLVETTRPADLSEGLKAALVRLAQRGAVNLNVHVEADDIRLDSVTETELYRIAQEGFHNILRHAEAENVWLRLRQAGKKVRFTLEDDGVGLADTSSNGLGLTTMRERAEALGGRLDLGARKGGGLMLSVEVPWQDS